MPITPVLKHQPSHKPTQKVQTRVVFPQALRVRNRSLTLELWRYPVLSGKEHSEGFPFFACIIVYASSVTCHLQKIALSLSIASFHRQGMSSQHRLVNIYLYFR